MNRILKMLSALTALCLTASALPAMQVGAWWWQETDFENMYLWKDDIYGYNGYTEIDGVTYHFNGSAGDCSFLIRTDGTVPTMDDFSAYDEVTSVVDWATYLENTKLHLFYSSIENTENLYVVYLEPEKDYITIPLLSSPYLDRIYRSLALEYDWITDCMRYTIGTMNALEVLGYETEEGVYTHEYSITLPPDMSCEEIMELAAYSPYLYKTYEDGSTIYVFDIVEESPETAHVTLEDYSFLLELDEVIREKYAVTETLYEFGSIAYAQNYSVFTGSVWKDCGDPNADGEVDSADAAELLVQAAQNGSVASAKATASAETPDPAADVNADGVVDALDASYVLQFAAANGSGAPVSWMELLRN